MKTNALIDLFVPAHIAPLDAIVAAAKDAGLDAVILAADDPEELPDPDEIAAFNAVAAKGNGDPYVHVGCTISGVGFRVLVLYDGDLESISLDAIEATGDLNLVHASVRELGGCALPICPRQGLEGSVLRQLAPLPETPSLGIVAMVAGGSPLGRDLDVEDAGIYKRRVLAASGPFADAKQLGRFATLLPSGADDMGGIIAALTQGYGVGIELGGHPDAVVAQEPNRGRGRGQRGQGPRGGRKSGGEGGGGEGGEGRPRKRRRSRRRKSGGEGGNSGGGGGQPAPA